MNRRTETQNPTDDIQFTSTVSTEDSHHNCLECMESKRKLRWAVVNFPFDKNKTELCVGKLAFFAKEIFKLHIKRSSIHGVLNDQFRPHRALLRLILTPVWFLLLTPSDSYPSLILTPYFTKTMDIQQLSDSYSLLRLILTPSDSYSYKIGFQSNSIH